MYNNIFSATYFFYKKHEISANYTALLAVSLCQMLISMLFISALIKFNFINLVGTNANYYLLASGILWHFILTKYYSKQRQAFIIERYSTKSTGVKRMWGIIALLHLIIPLIAIPILLAK